MFKKLIARSSLIVLILLFSCKASTQIEPPEWLIGYWWTTLNSSTPDIKAIQVTQDDILIIKKPGDFISLKDLVNLEKSPTFELVHTSNKAYRIRVLGDVFSFEYESKEEIHYKGIKYIRLTTD